MPELPEVETLRRELVLAVRGKKIKSVKIKWPKMVKPLSVSSFSRKLSGNKIVDISRRAKILIFELSLCNFLVVHLKMTGQLIFRAKGGKMVMGGHPQKGGADALPNKYTHIIINFTDGSVLYFNDLRKFGWMRLVDKKDLDKMKGDLGVEALSKGFSLKKFKEILDKYPNRKIKQILMDQKLIAGIGNIYADESCFCAGIMPSRVAKKINDKEISKLLKCIKRILKLAILKKGTSYDTYVQLSGKPGGFVPYLKVYGRGGKKCKKCKGKIEKIKMGGRGTHFCQKCQK